MIINDVKGRGKTSVKIFGLALAASCGRAVGDGPLLILSGVVAALEESGWNSPSRSFLAEKQEKGIKETLSSPTHNPVPLAPPSTTEAL